VDAVAAEFRREVGREPDGIWAAPGRVNLIGEHTDYNDGFVLPVAIDRRATVVAARRPDRRLRLWSRQEGAVELSLDDVGPGQLKGWSAYAAGPLWVLAEAGVDVGGMDLLLDSDVPAGAGLSSSAAVLCAVTMAAHDLAGGSMPPGRLALLARRAEVEVAGVPTGIMDQMVAMLATAGHALFLDTRSLATEQIPLPLKELDRTLLVIDTRAPHQLTDGAYADRQAACAAAARVLGVPALRDVTVAEVEAAAAALGPVGLRRARHVVTENTRVLDTVELLRARSLDEVGVLMVASHESLRDDFEVTVPELDVAVDAAMAAGAVGARMTGGGFGGSVIAVVPDALVDAVCDGVRSAFGGNGFGPPGIITATPSDGARRIA